MEISRTVKMNANLEYMSLFTEAVTRRCSVKTVLLEILQNSQENTCVRVSFFNKVASVSLQFYWKRGSGTIVFLWILRNFLKTFSYRTPLVAACVFTEKLLSYKIWTNNRQIKMPNNFTFEYFFCYFLFSDQYSDSTLDISTKLLASLVFFLLYLFN